MSRLFLGGVVLDHEDLSLAWEHFLLFVGVDDSAPSTVICSCAALLVGSERKLLLALVVEMDDGVVEVLGESVAGSCVEVEHVRCVLLVEGVLEPRWAMRRISPWSQRTRRMDFVLLI